MTRGQLALFLALWLAAYALLCVVAPEPDTTPPVTADAGR